MQDRREPALRLTRLQVAVRPPVPNQIALRVDLLDLPVEHLRVRRTAPVPQVDAVTRWIGRHEDVAGGEHLERVLVRSNADRAVRAHELPVERPLLEVL